MKKTISIAFRLILLSFFFLLFPFRAEAASEITIDGTSMLSINDRSKALAVMEDSFQSMLPEGKIAGEFTGTISSHLTDSYLCEYYSTFRENCERNGYGGALFYKTTLSIDGLDAAGEKFSYQNVVTTEPIEFTLAIPEYQRTRPNRIFIMFARDSSGSLVELGRGTDSIAFKTDFSYVWYDVAYVDEPTADRISFTVANPVPGELAVDSKYRPQTNSTLCDWDNQVSYSVPYRYTHYRWAKNDGADTDYMVDGDVFEEGKRYRLEMTFHISGNNPSVYINGRIPSWDIRSTSGTWGEFDIGFICTKEGLKQEAATPVINHQHFCADSDYEWDTIQRATETTDGEMRYQCKVCGNIKYSVPISAYYQFNANAVDKIKNAKKGATVSIDTPVFVSFHEMVKDELVARSDVTLVVTYKYKGITYQMVIPAGSAEKMAAQFEKSKFCGFRAMASIFATESK